LTFTGPGGGYESQVDWKKKGLRETWEKIRLGERKKYMKWKKLKNPSGES